MNSARPAVFAGLVCTLLVVGAGAAGPTAATASAVTTPGGVEIALGTFAVEVGATLAFEIVRDAPCPCLCDPVSVTELSLVNDEGAILYSESFDPAVDTSEWIGRVALVDAAGGTPLSPGRHTAHIDTTVGRFTAHIEGIEAFQLPDAGPFAASATACGLELRVYRLVTEADDGASIALRQGDRLMVLLAGNATTGFQWENALFYEFAVLRETDEPEYRAKPYPQDMVGFGGTFVFRYQAVAPGPQAFRFIYHQPWMSVQPKQVVEFDVTVY